AVLSQQLRRKVSPVATELESQRKSAPHFGKPFQEALGGLGYQEVMGRPGSGGTVAIAAHCLTIENQHRAFHDKRYGPWSRWRKAQRKTPFLRSLPHSQLKLGVL